MTSMIGLLIDGPLLCKENGLILCDGCALVINRPTDEDIAKYGYNHYQKIYCAYRTAIRMVQSSMMSEAECAKELDFLRRLNGGKRVKSHYYLDCAMKKVNPDLYPWFVRYTRLMELLG